jgi:hypothetical protein
MRSYDGPMDLVSGGYFVARRTRRTSHMNPALLPERILTASACLVGLVPDTWALGWTHEGNEERRKAAVQFGLTDEALQGITTWATAAFDKGRMGFPNVLLKLEAALELRRMFLPEDAVVFGIGLPQDLRASFMEYARVPDGMGVPGVVRAVEADASPAANGQPLGYDVLGWDVGSFHSYVCNGLESQFQSTFGVVPNAHGFYDSEEDARKCAAHANLDKTGAEPGLWLPWFVHAYAGL